MPEGHANDFYAPYFSAAIYDPITGLQIPLSQAVDPEILRQAGVPDALKALCFVTDAQVEMSLGPVPMLSVTLSPPYEAARMMLDSPLVEWGVSHLQLQFGYTSGTGGSLLLSPLYEGILLEPDITSGVDTTITLRAQGVGGLSATRQKSARVWNAVPRIKILQDLAAGSNPAQPRKLLIDASKVIASRLVGGSVPAGSLSEFKLLYEDPRTYAQGAKTDWWAMLQIARECKCDMYLSGHKVVLVPMNLALAETPKRLLRYYDHDKGIIDPAKGQLPILSFSTNTKAIYLPGALRGLRMADVDSATRNPVKALIDDSKVKGQRTGEGAAGPPKTEDYPDVNKETGGGGDQQAGSPSDPVAVQRAEAAYQQFTLNMGIQLTIETLGDPSLFPGDVVEVRGCGERLNGNYGILKITHKLGDSGYDMSLECVSNVGQLIGKARSNGTVYAEPEGEKNTKTTPEATDGAPVGAPADPT